MTGAASSASPPAVRKVFGIGLSRTGTTSLTRALELLGWRTVHFPDDARSQAELSAFLRAPEDALRLSLLDAVDALTDTPAAATFAALDRAYPGSAFVLTTRGAEPWLRSCERYWASVLDDLYATDPDAPYVRLVNRAVYGTDRFDRHAFLAAARRHEVAVRAHFAARPGDCLTLDVCAGEGWPELCGFLGVAVPGLPFPHANASSPQA